MTPDTGELAEATPDSPGTDLRARYADALRQADRDAASNGGIYPTEQDLADAVLVVRDAELRRTQDMLLDATNRAAGLAEQVDGQRETIVTRQRERDQARAEAEFRSHDNRTARLALEDALGLPHPDAAINALSMAELVARLRAELAEARQVLTDALAGVHADTDRQAAVAALSTLELAERVSRRAGGPKCFGRSTTCAYCLTATQCERCESTSRAIGAESEVESLRAQLARAVVLPEDWREQVSALDEAEADAARADGIPISWPRRSGFVAGLESAAELIESWRAPRETTVTDDTITRLRRQIALKDEARDRASERHRAALAALTPATLAGFMRLWWRGHRVASWRCRCGRRLGDDGCGCEWHMAVRAQAIAGLITEEGAR